MQPQWCCRIPQEQCDANLTLHPAEHKEDSSQLEKIDMGCTALFETPKTAEQRFCPEKFV